MNKKTDIRSRKEKPRPRPVKTGKKTQTKNMETQAAVLSGEYYTLFEQSPTPLWEDDFSAVKTQIDRLRKRGVKNFNSYFIAHPEKVAEYAKLVKVLNVNLATVKLYEASDKRSLMRQSSTITTEDSIEAFRSAMITLARGKTSMTTVTSSTTFKGARLDMVMHLNVLNGHEKDWSRVMISIIDITDWKKKSEALLESEEKLKAALEATEDGIIVVDPERRIISMNRQFIRMWSVPKKYARLDKNPSLYKLLLAKVADRGSFNARRIDIYKGAASFRDIIKLRDGRYFEVHTMPLSIQEKFSGRLWSFRDVTERYTAEKKIKKLNQELEKKVEKRTQDLTIAMEKISRREEELQQSEEMFRDTFDTAPHGMAIFDNHGLFIITNRAFTTIVGYRSKELKGKKFTDITHPHDIAKSEESFGRLTRGEVPSYQFEKRYIHKGGYPVWVLLSVSMVRDQKGNPLRILCQIIDITQTKKAEWLLRDSEEMYRRLFNEAIDAIFVADIETGKTIDCNKAATLLLGRSKNEIIGASHAIVHPPEELENGISRTYKQHSTTKQDELLETKVIRKDGSIRHVAIKASRFEYKGKMYIQGIFRDITEQKAAEDNIKLFFSITLDMLCIAGLDGYFKQISPSWSHTLGWTTEELTSRPFLDFIHPDDVAPTLKAVERLGEGKVVVNFENRYRCSDGSYRWISWNSFAVFEKQLIYAAARDMTLRKNEEERLRQSEENLRLVIEDLPLAIAISTGEKIDYANMMFADLFGYTIDEITTIEDWFLKAYPDRSYRDEVTSVWATLLETARKTGGKVLPMEVKVRCRDGTDKQIEIRATVIGERIIVNFYDLTKRKEEELALVRARDEAESANRAKSEFLANMSHEIRTPLNAVIGFSELLSDMTADMKQTAYLQSIKTAGKSLLTLINDILDLSKIEAGMMDIKLNAVEPVSLFMEVKEIFASAIDSKGISFVVDLDPLLPRGLLLDEIRLRQVLVNLLGNAVKFTERGHIKLSARCLPQKNDSSKIDLLILVEDTGIGIPESNLDLIFKSFAQQAGQDAVKYGGTGLGLSISRRLVEMMNGSITVTSAVGKGSTFFVTIHEVSIAAVGGATPRAASGDSHVVHFSDTRALVVDDVASNRLLIMELLKKWGMRVLEAENGQEALLLAEQYSPDIILMDLRMPVMDGFSAFKEIQKLPQKNIPILALTASADSNNMQLVLNAGFAGYLTKPIDSEMLMNEISRCLPGSVMHEAIIEKNENVSGHWAPASIDPKIAAAILSEIDSGIIPDIQKISGTIIIGDIKRISDRIRSIGERHGAEFLIEWSMLLNKYAATVDIKGVQAVLETIREARSSLASRSRSADSET